MRVFEADEIKAVERLVGSRNPTPGDTPASFKRKRGVYRALKRGCPHTTFRFTYELALERVLRALVLDLYR